jgi:hypothetical protein
VPHHVEPLLPRLAPEWCWELREVHHEVRCHSGEQRLRVARVEPSNDSRTSAVLASGEPAASAFADRDSTAPGRAVSR